MELTEDQILSKRWFKVPQKALDHKMQQKLLSDLLTRAYRFFVIVAGRRSYKTERFLKRFTIKYAIENDEHICVLAAPTRDQAKLLYWEDVKLLMPQMYVKKTNETSLTITLKNGSTIQIIGLMEYQRREGARCHLFGVSEWQQCNPKAWFQTFAAMINDTEGIAIFEGRPFEKNHLFDFYNYALMGKPGWASYHWTSEDILTDAQIAENKSNLSLLDYAREHLASFETGGKSPYYSYSVLNNRTKNYDYKLPFIVTCDFNATVKPMSWVIGQKQLLGVNEVVYWKKTLSYQHTNTITMCELLDQDYFQKLPEYITKKEYPSHIIFYGDYAGKKMTSNSSWSDWDIIKKYFNNKAKIELKIKPCRSIRNSIGSTNAQLKNANKILRQFIDKKECEALMMDWIKCTWKDNSRELKDDDDLRGHCCRAVDYFNDFEYPAYPETEFKVE